MRAEYRVELHRSVRTYSATSPNSICCNSVSNKRLSLLTSNREVASAMDTDDKVTSFVLTVAANAGERNNRSVVLSSSARLCLSHDTIAVKKKTPNMKSIYL